MHAVLPLTDLSGNEMHADLHVKRLALACVLTICPAPFVSSCACLCGTCSTDSSRQAPACLLQISFGSTPRCGALVQLRWLAVNASLTQEDGECERKPVRSCCSTNSYVHSLRCVTDCYAQLAQWHTYRLQRGGARFWHWGCRRSMWLRAATKWVDVLVVFL